MEPDSVSKKLEQAGVTQSKTSLGGCNVLVPPSLEAPGACFLRVAGVISPALVDPAPAVLRCFRAVCSFFFSAVLRSLRDLSSSTRD